MKKIIKQSKIKTIKKKSMPVWTIIITKPATITFIQLKVMNLTIF